MENSDFDLTILDLGTHGQVLTGPLSCCSLCADLLDILKIQNQRVCPEMPECVKSMAGPKWKREICVVISPYISVLHKPCSDLGITGRVIKEGKKTLGNTADK